MIRKVGSAAVLLTALLMINGCFATRGQLKKGLDAQSAALSAERSERVAADEKLAADLAQLRTDLNSLRTEFGAKITALEEGLSFAFPVHFAFDDATVQQSDVAALDKFADVVNKHFPGTIVTIEGFADPAGSIAYNKRLSTKRADAVRTYLVGREVQADLKTIGYGESRPVVPGAEKNDVGAELNRRVVFVVESTAPAARVTAANLD